MPQRNTTTDVWALVSISNPDSCWEWQGHRNHAGYGRVRYNGKRLRAHRLIFELTYGYCPEVVRHRCDNPPCCNPDHLLPGTHQDNVSDRVVRGRTRARQLHGEQVKTAKLTTETVRLIRARYVAGGITQEQLAQEHDVSQSLIGRVLRRVAWKTA